MDLSNIWAFPLFCFAVFAIIWGVSDILSYLTKGFLPGLIIASAIYLFGFLSGIIPSDIIGSNGEALGNAVINSTLMTSVGAFVIPLILVNLGTTITISQFIAEWKTVVVALSGLVGLAVISFTASSFLFGREYALCAASPIAGGAIASVMTQQAADLAGFPVFGAFAMLVNGFQGFVGSPLSTICLKKQASKFLKSETCPQLAGNKHQFNFSFIPELPARLQTPFVIIAKVASVAIIANLLSGVLPFINVNIMYLLCGILFCEIGFLDRQSLAKANASGFLTLALVAACVASFSSVDVEGLLDMIVPIIGCLLVGAAGVVAAGGIAGRLLGWDIFVSIAVSLTCMVGYPATQINTEGVCKMLDCDAATAARIQDYLMPKMIVGGFTTVTVASVVFAGIVTPMIF